MKKTPSKPAAKPEAKPPMRLTEGMVSAIVGRLQAESKAVPYELTRPVLPPGVVPANAKDDPAYMALDAGLDALFGYAAVTYGGMGFPGYPVLAEMAQQSEYRSPTETTAQEMTRKWIKVTAQGGDDYAEKIAIIEAELKRHRVQDVFNLAAQHDGFYGRGQVYIKLKGQDGPEVRAAPLVIDSRVVGKGDLLGFKNIEPMWTTPQAYNSIDPAADDFYKPTMWFVMGTKTHDTRLLNFCSRPVPDMLKPAYNFGGMSLTQLMQPYVESWLRTRKSISDLLHSFSVSGLATDLQTLLADAAAGSQLFLRAELFNKLRDNRGLMLLNKDSEEFFQFNTPLSGLSELQAQSQEQMAAPSHTPLVKLLGITPSGLNASAEGEMTCYYDHIRARQEQLFTHPLNVVLQLIQLDQFGEIDPAIGFEFEPLTELTGKELAEVRKSDGDRAAAYIDRGVISPEEERARLAGDPNSGYNNIDVEDVPTPPENPDDAAAAGELGEDSGRWSVGAWDAAWEEGKHPRAANGQFGSGGGGASQWDGEKDYVDAAGRQRQGGLTHEERRVERAFYAKLENNSQKMMAKYRERFGREIDPDNVKTLYRSFSANQHLAKALHEPSSAFAKQMLAEFLLEKKAAGDTSPTLFTAGGGGSGKSATKDKAVEALGATKDPLTVDSVLGNFDKARDKIQAVLDADENATVGIVYTNTHMDKAMRFNATRSRAVSGKTLANAHMGASSTIKKLAEHFKGNPRVSVLVMNNNGTLDEVAQGKLEDVPDYGSDRAAVHAHLASIADEMHASGELHKVAARYNKQKEGESDSDYAARIDRLAKQRRDNLAN